MNDESQALLAKAERAIRAANTLLRAGDPDFLDAFDQRIVGDYGVTAMLTSEDAALVIAHAEEFLSAATQHLKGLR